MSKNFKTGISIALGNSNTVGSIFASSGNVGIGTTSPAYPLHIGNSQTANTYYSFAFYAYNGNAYTGGAGGTESYSLYTISRILGQQFNAFSDMRIKKNIVDIDDVSALEVLRQIQPKRYNYIDEINRGTTPVWGFIAQQVGSVLNYSTKTISDYIPNIYELANVTDNNTIVLQTKTTSDLKVGNLIRIVKIDNTFCDTKITNIIDNITFTVESDLSEIQNENKIFVYGIKVDDFNTLDKDAIFTITTAALQEVDRELQAEKQTVSDLEQKIQNLESFIQSKFPGEYNV